MLAVGSLLNEGFLGLRGGALAMALRYKGSCSAKPRALLLCEPGSECHPPSIQLDYCLYAFTALATLLSKYQNAPLPSPLPLIVWNRLVGGCSERCRVDKEPQDSRRQTLV